MDSFINTTKHTLSYALVTLFCILACGCAGLVQRSNFQEAHKQAGFDRELIEAGRIRPLTVSSAKQALVSRLRDPDSVKFIHVRRNVKTGAVCGQVNAKNAFGGYVGFSPFVYFYETEYGSSQLLYGSEIAISAIESYTNAFCPSDSTTIMTTS